MTITNLRFLLLLLALFLSGVSYAGAHKSSPPGGYASGGMHMGMLPRMGEKLGLSEAQKQDMAALMEMYGPRFKELASRGKADREALMAMAPDDSAYGELTAVVSNEAGLAASEAVTLMSELQGNVYALLKPEQQAKYLELRTAQKDKMQSYRKQREACMGKDADPQACKSMHKGKDMGMHKRMHRKHQDGERCPDRVAEAGGEEAS
ncbi:MAG: hypothetical protein GY746_11860 [Gammaproteobacteria bacterium]|nr:hypothetical protein [Gammaproteobacteria bacterium]MCP4927964.1 hypothetical protein [Gammaproteobacteria bacterium]